MRIIISPAKKMNIETDLLAWNNLPQFLPEAEKLADYLKTLNYEELKTIWKCNDKIASLNYDRVQNMDLRKTLTPAILSYEGIQYQYMAPQVMEETELQYIEEHLRILSGFYGMLRPFDGIIPYRLEMQSRLQHFETDTLYQFWNHKLFDALRQETGCILNLASKEYSKCITAYNKGRCRMVTCIFGEMSDGKVKEKGTFAKMARGEMVRFLAGQLAEDVEMAKKFTGLGYKFRNELSDEETYVFVKE
ncbi:MAG: peroxide stress protein YaaA [Lachnospiraceae bacterium]